MLNVWLTRPIGVEPLRKGGLGLNQELSKKNENIVVEFVMLIFRFPPLRHIVNPYPPTNWPVGFKPLINSPPVQMFGILATCLQLEMHLHSEPWSFTAAKFTRLKEPTPSSNQPCAAPSRGFGRKESMRRLFGKSPVCPRIVRHCSQSGPFFFNRW
jgi:hypothetical protein